jgi:hypothetical protein
MSIRVLTQVWDSDRLKGTELLVLLCLADYANDEGICWPSIGKIAMRTRQSPRNARRLIERLEKKKIIERQLRADDTTLYRIKFKALLDQPQETTGVDMADHPGQIRPGRSGSAGVDETDRTPRTNSTASPDRFDRTPRSDSTAKPSLNRKEPSEDPSLFCSEPSGSKPAPGDDAVITLPLNDKTEHPVTKAEIAEWTPLYPAIDVMQQLRLMRGWLLGNPSNRKTKSGVNKFIHKWLAKEQNSARPERGERSRPSDASFIGQPIDMAVCWADDCGKQVHISKLVAKHFCSTVCQEKWAAAGGHASTRTGQRPMNQEGGKCQSLTY